MCCCDNPTINGQMGYRWQPHDAPSVREVSPPALGERGTLLYDEPGRCGGLDCHSHHFRVVRITGSYWLYVLHGGRQEEFRMSVTTSMMDAMAAMESNVRFWFLHAIYSAYSDGNCEGAGEERRKWNKAAAEKRIKTRKQRDGSVKVWVNPALVVE